MLHRRFSPGSGPGATIQRESRIVEPNCVQFCRRACHRNAIRLLQHSCIKKSRKIIIVVIAVTVAALSAGFWWWFRREKVSDDITLYGNVDVRQVSLAFNANERVAEMRANEGDRVKQGQVLAVLVTTTLELHIAKAQAQADVQQQTLRRLRTGTRPQEISQARAGAAAAEAEATKASQQYEQLQAITNSTGGRGVSRQDLDAAIAAQGVAQAERDNAGKTLELAVLGPR